MCPRFYAVEWNRKHDRLRRVVCMKSYHSLSPEKKHFKIPPRSVLKRRATILHEFCIEASSGLTSPARRTRALLAALVGDTQSQQSLRSTLRLLQSRLRSLLSGLHSVLRSFHRLRLLVRRTQGQAKTEVVRTERRYDRVAVRRPAIPRVVVPTAAAKHTGRARCCAGWIARCR